MSSLFVDVDIVDASGIVDVATNRILYKLPNGGLGIDYGNVIKEVYRSPDGNLVAGLSHEVWEKSYCKIAKGKRRCQFTTTTAFSENQRAKGKATGFYADESFQKVFDSLIELFNLSARSVNGLNASSVFTIRDLVLLHEVELFKLPNLGERSVNEIKDLITSLGLYLGMNSHEINSDSDGLLDSTPDFDNNDNLILSQNVDYLDPSIRASNGLQARGIKTIGDLVRVLKVDLLRTPDLGPKTIIELEKKLATIGLSFEMTDRCLRTYTHDP